MHQPDKQYEGRQAQRRASGRSWISSLASPITATQQSPPPPLPTINVTSQSPVSPARTIRLEHLPVSAPRTKQVMPGDLDTNSSKESMSTHEDREKDITNIKYDMSTVEEVTEYPNSPMTPITSRMGGKARIIVDGLVSGIRSIPKAVTHNQIHDRRSSVGSRTSRFTGTDRRTTMTIERDSAVAFRFNPPTPFPAFVFAPQGYPPQSMASPMSLDQDPMSKLGSEGDAADLNADDTHLARITNLFSSFNRMPWISPTRVAVDYIPGNSRKSSVPAYKTKHSSSWYTMTAPATPSDISNPWRTLPEPWFPPTELPTTMEEPEAEAIAGQETVEGGDGHGHEENLEEKLRELREELQEKSRQLSDLRQVVEHQKLHISVLEADLEGLRKVGEQQVELHRRRSSVRRSTLRPRDSLGVAAVRRTSVRVSRPGSNFFD
ncbi:hypothetical protein BDY19DRAFT_994076 [Irpex rosettiformis]|uniref:Uncharacterized protein n=1 Tax=Irpex rosettiformis TaxID=378272 RepID=A0ACB8U2W1_9APHY|nr:hypothetical protein BDY19DRAFT_994076 [Irpex rosettiformis]